MWSCRQSYAIKNLLLLASDPKSIIINGKYDNGSVSQGTISLGFNLVSILPFLPDPYATNVVSHRLVHSQLF
jgi:hypothetical protein